MKRILFTLLIACFSLSLFAQGDILQKGQQVPDFEFLSAKGKMQKISNLKGQVVLINFFATWCGPCRMELPVLQENIWKKYKSNKDFSLLVIGRGHSAEELKTFQEKAGLDLPMYPDLDKSIFARFASQSIPRNYIIDRNGKVAYASLGYSPEEFQDLIKVLDQVMNNKL